jgi:TolB-like protein
MAELRQCAARVREYAPFYSNLVLAAFETGRMEEARAAVREVRRLRPGWTLRDMAGRWYFRDPAVSERWRRLPGRGAAGVTVALPGPVRLGRPRLPGRKFLVRGVRMETKLGGAGFSFGRWRLLPDARQLLADGEPVPLGSRAFDVLFAPVEARGELVTKDALLNRVWPSTIVEENNLQVQVSALRRALGADAARFIVNVPGRGYRFTGVVGPPDASLSPPEVPAERVSSSLAKPMLVVLPFANMTGDPEQEYFADGIAEDLTTALSHLRWFSVIARNSAFTYKGRAVDVRQVGRELGVGYVLEGSVRKAGGRVRITAQLCEAETGRHVWAERFDGDLTDVFDLQDRITESVTGAIEPSLRLAEGERIRTHPTESLGAYDRSMRSASRQPRTPRRTSSRKRRCAASSPGTRRR